GLRHSTAHPYPGASEKERVPYVVAVAADGLRAVAEAAELLVDRHQVGERLARMLALRERVHDRYLRRGGEPGEGGVTEHPDDDRIDVARQRPRHVLGRLAAADPYLGSRQRRRRAAKAANPDLERDPRPEARLVEDQGDVPAGEGPAARKHRIGA